MKEIQKDPSLLDDRLLQIYNRINIEIINFHNLPFCLFETLRTPDRQKMLFDAGFTKTMHSKHLPNADGKSEAMDLVLYIDNKPTWDFRYQHYYNFLGNLVLNKFSDDIVWGGTFKSFYDGPHFQLK